MYLLILRLINLCLYIALSNSYSINICTGIIMCYRCHYLVEFWFMELKINTNPTWFYYNIIFRICPSTVLCLTIISSDSYDLLYLIFYTVLQYLFLSDIFICLDRSWTMFGLRLRFWINGSEIEFLASKHSGWKIDFLF